MAALPGAVSGQVGQPIQLLPKTTPQYEAPPPDVPDSDTGTAEPSAPQGFEIAPLDAIGTDYAGTLEPEQGGFGLGMWQGTDRIKVERLLPALKPTTSPILAELTRRLLLSNAAAPAGRGSGKSLLPLRAAMLADMGLVEEATALLRLVPADQRDADSARLLTELSWRAGDPDGACAVVQESLPRLPVGIFWEQAAIFCQLRAGQTDQATLGLDLLREQGESDEVFFALADAMAGNAPAELPPLPVVTPLYLAMAQAAGLPVPQIAIHEPPPLLLALIAESPGAGREQRLAAAETAAAAGVLPSKHLAAAYTAEPADQGTLDTALDREDIRTTPETRAILYQAAVRAGTPKQRIWLVQKALDGDVLDPDYWTRLQLYLPLLADISATPDLALFADNIARHLYVAGQFEKARAWVRIVEESQLLDGPKVAIPNLLALDYLAGGSSSAPQVLEEGAPVYVDRPLVSLTDPLGTTSIGDRIERVRAIIDSFSVPLDYQGTDMQASIAATTSPAKMPRRNVNLWLDLGDAAAKNRVGETVLLALAGLNETGLADAEPEWLSRSIASLRDVGLVQEARRLAIEAAIVNGL